MAVKFTFIIFLSLILLIGIAAAQEEEPDCEHTLPPTALGDCKELIQTCANCTFVNITKIYYPQSNGSSLNLNVGMTAFANTYNYTFCDNNYLGTYMYSTIGNPDGSSGQGNVCYKVTPSGTIFTNELSIPLFLPMGLMLLLALFFFFFAGMMAKPEYKLTFIIFAGVFVVFTIAFGIVASREVLWGFPLLYGFVNSFYRIFIITIVSAAIITAIILMFFVVTRTFSRRGYNITAKGHSR